MFDQIMENAMPMWLLVSALFPILFFGTIIKAILHYRRMRSLREYLPTSPITRFQSDDWIATP